MSEEKKDVQQPTLTEFIENNQKMISTAGVLAALSVLANKLLANQLGGKFLSFLLLLLVLIICFEIFETSPWTEKGRLHWFLEVSGMAVLVFIIVWVEMFYPFLLIALLMIAYCFVLVFVFALCFQGVKLVLKIPWFKSVNQRAKEQLIPMFGAMALMVAGLVVLRHFKFFWRH